MQEDIEKEATVEKPPKKCRKECMLIEVLGPQEERLKP
jgi:hypothetical protein